MGAWGPGGNCRGQWRGPPEGDGHSPEMLAHDLRASAGTKGLCVTMFEGFKGDD